MNMSTDYFARQRMVLSPDASNMIKNIRILVVGAGAGGNEVLKNLLLMGFGNITIIDFDHVEDSNLSRTTLFRKEDIGKSKALVAAERLTEIALHDKPNIHGIHGNLMTDVGKHIFWEHDIVICCVDTQKARAYINDWCVRSNTPFFEMGFKDFNVNISFFAPEGEIVQTDGIQIEKLPSNNGLFPVLKGRFPVCLRELIGFGKFEERRNSCSTYKYKDVNLAKIPTIQVAAAMAGVLVATELVKYLDGKDNLKNKMLMFYGLRYGMEVFGFNRTPNSKIYDEMIEDIKTINVCSTTTLKDLLESIAKELNTDDIILILPEKYIISGHCHCCGKEIVYKKRHSLMVDDERWCEECRRKHPDYESLLNYPSQKVEIPEEISFGTDNEVLMRTLSDAGIPTNDVMMVKVCSRGDDHIHYVTNQLI